MKTKISDIYSLLDKTMCIKCKENIEGKAKTNCKCSHYLNASYGIINLMPDLLDISELTKDCNYCGLPIKVHLTPCIKPKGEKAKMGIEVDEKKLKNILLEEEDKHEKYQYPIPVKDIVRLVATRVEEWAKIKEE